MHEETVEVQTLPALEVFQLSQVDAIKLDSQGTELEILKGLGPELSRDLSGGNGNSRNRKLRG